MKLWTLRPGGAASGVAAPRQAMSYFDAEE